MKHILKTTKSKIAHVQITFDAGALAESEKYNHGVAHALEHMLFKGTDKRSYKDISREIAMCGGVSNAYTAYEQVTYFINLPYENLEKAFDILSDMLYNSRISEEEFSKEIEVIKEELYGRNDSVQSFIFEKIYENIYKDRLSIPIIGTEESLCKITAKELRDFKKEFYTDKNGFLTVVSRHKKSELKTLAEKYFGKSSSFNERKFKILENNNPKKSFEAERDNLEHTYFYLMYPTKSFGEITSMEEVTESLMLSILGGSMDSRLFEEVREKHGLCYAIGSDSVRMKHGSTIYISASTREKNIPMLKQVIREELNKLIEFGVTDEELEKTINQERANSYRLRESSSKLCSLEIHSTFYRLPSMEEYDALLPHVTSEHIKEYAKRVFSKDSELEFVCKNKSV